MRMAYIFLIATLLLVGIIFLAKSGGITGNVVKSGDNGDGNRVLLETTMGDIVIELFDDTPITAGNFKKLVSEGFYDGIVFS